MSMTPLEASPGKPATQWWAMAWDEDGELVYGMERCTARTKSEARARLKAPPGMLVVKVEAPHRDG